MGCVINLIVSWVVDNRHSDSPEESMISDNKKGCKLHPLGPRPRTQKEFRDDD